MAYIKQSNSVPNADESSDSRKMFNEREFFDEEFFPDYLPTIDLWEHPRYGRVSPSGLGMFPDEAFLSPVPGSNALFALQFVSTAFGGLLSYIESKRSGGHVRDSWLMSQLKPRLAWRSMVNAHFEHCRNLLPSFIRWNNGRSLRTIECFIDRFVEFARDMEGEAQLSLESFSKGQNSDIFMTGLAISLRQNGASSDKNRVRWIKDPNFSFYCKAAKAHGFLVSKRSPWMLIYDLHEGGSNLEPDSGGIDKGPFLCYNLIYKLDYQVLNNMLITMFRSYLGDLRKDIQKVFKEGDLNTDLLLRSYMKIREVEERSEIPSDQQEMIRVISKHEDLTEGIRRVNLLLR